jgi:2-keto-4-pentenoate hydratase/2-oxohepta-3-ene-1,7-dioic acid hydratase in catechol pathway
MKYCRYELNNEHHYGLIEPVAGREVITRVVLIPPGSDEPMDELPTRKIEQIAVAEAKLLPPTLPSKIVCLGRNYAAHARELGHELPSEPLIFLKPPSAVIGPGKVIRRPKDSARVEHEAELAVIISKRCRHVREDEDVREYIRGYTCLNDVTARDLQEKDGQWTRAKGFDTFCPIGPVVNDELDPWSGVSLACRVNGEVRQQGSTADFIFALDVVLRFISRVMTLLPGDVIATGTPEGVGPLVAGDVVEVSVENVGSLSNPVADDTAG